MATLGTPRTQCPRRRVHFAIMYETNFKACQTTCSYKICTLGIILILFDHLSTTMDIPESWFLRGRGHLAIMYETNHVKNRRVPVLSWLHLVLMRLVLKLWQGFRTLLRSQNGGNKNGCRLFYSWRYCLRPIGHRQQSFEHAVSLTDRQNSDTDVSIPLTDRATVVSQISQISSTSAFKNGSRETAEYSYRIFKQFSQIFLLSAKKDETYEMK